VCVYLCVCMCACVRSFVHSCVRACMHACVYVYCQCAHPWGVTVHNAMGGASDLIII